MKSFLFDLGGVVIAIDFQRAVRSWARDADCTPQEIQSRFSFDAAYMAHERGEISSSEYFQALRKTLGVDLSEAQLEAGWNAIFHGEVAGIGPILEKIKERAPLYAFTNSNPSHEKTWSQRYQSLLANFTAVYNSSSLGTRKPEPEAFRTVAARMGTSLSEIVFYDDTRENIQAARELGMVALPVISIFDIEDTYREYLPPEESL